MTRSFLVLVFVGIALSCGGFLHFARSLPASVSTGDVSGDAIVVLTGAPARISAGFRLLAEKRGRRMLISGVFPATTQADIQRMINGDEALFACCVDIDHDAMDTLGNAEQTRVWAKRHGFDKLIIVTSTYHMPRSMMELQRALPKVDLVAYPVPVSTAADWWSDPDIGRIYMSEYAKYIFALLRNRFDDLT